MDPRTGSGSRARLLLLLCVGALACLALVYGLGAWSAGAVGDDAAASPPSPERLTAAAPRGAAGAPAPDPRVAAAPAPAAGPVSDDAGDEPGARAARGPEASREGEFYTEFLAAAAERPRELAAEAEGILLGPGPDPRKVALLRVAHDRRLKNSADLWLLALRELPDVSDPQGESVPSTALLLLDRSARLDPRSREVLRRAAFEPPLPAPDLRARAGASFFRYAGADELLAVRDLLDRERDPRFLESALQALSHNSERKVADGLLAAHGLPPPAERDPPASSPRDRGTPR